MAVDFREGDGLPPSELLKDDDNLSDNRNIPRKAPGRESMIVDIGSSVSSSLSSLNSTFGSEFGSTETESDEDDDDFIAELTRQMANYMLEEDDEKDSGKCGSEDLKHPSGSTGLAQYTISGSGYEGLDSGLSSPTSVPAQAHPVFPEDQTRTIQLYKLENQPTVESQGSACWGKQARRAELTQQPEQNTKFSIRSQTKAEDGDPTLQVDFTDGSAMAASAAASRSGFRHESRLPRSAQLEKRGGRNRRLLATLHSQPAGGPQKARVFDGPDPCQSHPCPTTPLRRHAQVTIEHAPWLTAPAAERCC